jgi:hypothetical protein
MDRLGALPGDPPLLLLGRRDQMGQAGEGSKQNLPEPRCGQPERSQAPTVKNLPLPHTRIADCKRDIGEKVFILTFRSDAFPQLAEG